MPPRCINPEDICSQQQPLLYKVCIARLGICCAEYHVSLCVFVHFLALDCSLLSFIKYLMMVYR